MQVTHSTTLRGICWHYQSTLVDFVSLTPTRRVLYTTQHVRQLLQHLSYSWSLNSSQHTCQRWKQPKQGWETMLKKFTNSMKSKWLEGKPTHQIAEVPHHLLWERSLQLAFISAHLRTWICPAQRGWCLVPVVWLATSTTTITLCLWPTLLCWAWSQLPKWRIPID